jgi:hypothetical protein
MINGVQFVVDGSGGRTAVILDLRKHRKLWEDIQDRLLIESRRHEPRSSIQQVRKRLERRTTRAHA